MVGAKIGQGFPPICPLTIRSNVCRCSFVAVESTHTFPAPPPSWMARGHLAMSAKPRPSRPTSPHRPFLILMAHPPSQKPLVGGALKLHGQPQSQLHAVMMSAV